MTEGSVIVGESEVPIKSISLVHITLFLAIPRHFIPWEVTIFIVALVSKKLYQIASYDMLDERSLCDEWCVVKIAYLLF